MSYAQPPPSYSSTNNKGYSAIPQDDPLTNPAAAQASGAGRPIDPTEPRQEGDVDDDDFKYGVTVDQSTAEVRTQFLKKVYSILFIQLTSTAIVAGIMTTKPITAWVQEHQAVFLLPLFGSLVTMGLLFWKRHSHPLNLGLLGLFTLLEAFSLGAIVSYVDQVVVLQALVITGFVFLGLTLFTFQSNWDFSKMGPYLLGALMLFVGVGFVQIFLPFSKMADLGMAVAGVLIFSLYIVYDTHMICKRLPSDEWVLASISLYLDVLNLFISILRILNNQRED